MRSANPIITIDPPGRRAHPDFAQSFAKLWRAAS